MRQRARGVACLRTRAARPHRDLPVLEPLADAAVPERARHRGGAARRLLPSARPPARRARYDAAGIERNATRLARQVRVAARIPAPTGRGMTRNDDYIARPWRPQSLRL